MTAACNGSAPRVEPDGPVVEVPAPEPVPSAAPAPSSVEPTTTARPVPKSGQANPVDADGRTIHLAYNADDRCFVYLPFPPLRPGEQRPPGTAPPSRDVPCPAEMQNEAYRSCRGGIVSYKGEACECFEHGNPPRVSPNPCP